MSRSEMQLQPVNLSLMVEEIRQQQHRHHPQRRLKSIVAPGITAQGEPQLLQMALENLLDNA